jgi:hypothetical protein
MPPSYEDTRMKRLDPAHYLEAPDLELDPRKRATFDAMYQAALDQGPNSIIDYRADYPKHEFLAYLVKHKDVLLHGSNNGGISVLKPKWQTDYLGKPVKAIFATPDGIWPMFFAILDREVYQGSLRNGCFWVHDPEGDPHKCYHFSINAAALPHEPRTDGTIYVVPRDSFRRGRDLADQPLEEWTSTEPVRPLARLPVRPEDFPFLRQVEGHDEATLARLERAPDELFKGFHELAELEDGYELRYDGTAQWDAQLMEFIRRQRKQSPGLSYELVFEPEEGPIRLRLRGARGAKPEIQDKINSFLDARNTPAPATPPDGGRA